MLFIILKSMGIQTKITRKGIVSVKVSDEDESFSSEVTKSSTAQKSQTALTGSAGIHTGSFGSCNLIQSGTHPSVTFVLPSLIDGDQGEEMRVLSEGEGWAILTLSGTNPIVGASWEYVVSSSLVGTHAEHVMSVSGTNGMSWMILSSTGSFAGVQV